MDEHKGTFRLTMRQGPTPGKAFDLVKDLITIGRDVSNEIVVNDAEVSRNHARLTAQAGSYQLEDLASTNGVMVNGQRLTGPKLLQLGDIMGLGETVTLEFSMYSESASTVVASKPAPEVVVPPPPIVVASPPPLPTTAPFANAPEPTAPPPLASPPAPEPYVPYTPPPPAAPPVAEPSYAASPINDWEVSPPSVALPIPEAAALVPEPKPQTTNWPLIIGIGCGCLTVLCVCVVVVAAIAIMVPGMNLR